LPLAVRLLDRNGEHVLGYFTGSFSQFEPCHWGVRLVGRGVLEDIPRRQVLGRNQSEVLGERCRDRKIAGSDDTQAAPGGLALEVHRQVSGSGSFQGRRHDDLIRRNAEQVADIAPALR
jgi:hypothetical protein